MTLMSLLRVSPVVLGSALLASCATTHTSNQDPGEWSFNPMVEARKFYASGQSVDDYVKGKPLKDEKGVNVYYLCEGLISAGDEARFHECRRVYDRLAAEPQNKLLAPTFATYREYMDISANQFLLEQSQFKQVEKNLLPYMTRDAAIITFDRSRAKNANFRRMAAVILARAQRNLGGITEPVRNALSADMGTLTVLLAVFHPKSVAVMQAERDYLQGQYEECFQKVPPTSVGAVGLGMLFGQLDGSAASLESFVAVEYGRLQAICAFEAGRFDEARLAYEELLKLPDVPDLRGLVRLAHHQLGMIALRKGDKVAATRHLKSAITALESERAALDTEAGRLGYATNKSEIYALLVELLVEQGQDGEAFEYAERGKARALIDMLASKRSATGGGSFAAALKAVDEADLAYASVPTAAGAGTRRGIVVRQQLAKSSPQVGSLVSAEALPLADVQRHLKPQETLVEYFGEGPRLFAFVVTKGRVKAVRLDAKAVSDRARAFRQALMSSSTRDYQAVARRLYEAALAPAIAHADAGALTLVPHGDLHYVPFAAMHDGRSYMVQKGEIRYLPSASVLPFLRSSSNAGNGLLILGNPDLGNRSLDLPGAEQEAKLLERSNRGARVLLRSQATETALRRLGPQYREIHFAMHGKFNSEHAMSSGLYMARDAENDGVLSVSELYDLQLNADLVVLSACETALGDTSKGNDVVGLNRGFLFAGAKSIVSSLWEVDDNATRDLMVAFYQQRARHGKAGGLRQAQLATLAKYPHPYYWAAFQMSGSF